MASLHAISVGIRTGATATSDPVAFLKRNLYTTSTAKSASSGPYTYANQLEHGEHPPLPKLEVRPSPGKGLGLWTREFIPAYTKILEDDALLSLARGEDLPDLWRKYIMLPSEDKEIFDSLISPARLNSTREEVLRQKLTQRGIPEFQVTTMSQVSSRFQANAFKTGGMEQQAYGDARDRYRWTYALFPTVARINHSCVPNSHAHYASGSGSQVLYSMCDIAPETEITISYFNHLLSASAKQERAFDWGFTCNCPACSREGPFADGTYERATALIVRVYDTRTEIPQYPVKAIEDARRAIEVATKHEWPWLIASLPALYMALALRLQTAVERRPDAFAYLDLEKRKSILSAHRWEARLTGPTSLQSQQYWAGLNGPEHNEGPRENTL